MKAGLEAEARLAPTVSDVISRIVDRDRSRAAHHAVIAYVSRRICDGVFTISREEVPAKTSSSDDK